MPGPTNAKHPLQATPEPDTEKLQSRKRRMIRSHVSSARHIPRVPPWVRTPYMRHCQEVWDDSCGPTCMTLPSKYLLHPHCYHSWGDNSPVRGSDSSESKGSTDHRSTNVSCAAIQPTASSETLHPESQQKVPKINAKAGPAKRTDSQQTPTTGGGTDDPCAHVGCPHTATPANGQPLPYRFTQRKVIFIRSSPTKRGHVR